MEYRSVIKEDLSLLDGRISNLDNRVSTLDNRILQLDHKIDTTAGNLRLEIKDAKIDTIKWMIGVFLALALMILGLYIKR